MSGLERVCWIVEGSGGKEVSEVGSRGNEVMVLGSAGKEVKMS